MAKPQKLTFITGNTAKAEQMAQYLHMQIPHQKLDLLEIQSLDLQEVVEHKAQEAFSKVGTPVLVEDSSLLFKALGQLPGTLIKWFEQELDYEGICRLLDGYPDRGAIVEVMLGLYDGHRLRTFYAFGEGSIAEHPRGSGFGWDVIFIPKGHSKTRGEMTPEEHEEVSVRRLAAQKLEQALKNTKNT